MSDKVRPLAQLRRALVVLVMVLGALAFNGPAEAATVIGYDEINTPIYDTANYRGQVCGDGTDPNSIYVRNNLRDLAPRLLLRKGSGFLDVRGYNDTARGMYSPNHTNAWWWYGTGNDGAGHTYRGWVFLNHITYRDGACH